MAKAKEIRWVFASDLHGDHAHPPTLAALRHFIKDFKPHFRIFGGDLWDMRWISRHTTPTERAESTWPDIEAGLDFIDWFKPSVFMFGNHDARMFRALRDSTHGVYRDHAKAAFEALDNSLPSTCRVVPYSVFSDDVAIGDCIFTHGFAHGANAARSHLGVWNKVVHGHTHTSGATTLPGKPYPRKSYSVGTLCELDMQYNEAKMGSLAWENGWAYGFSINGATHVLTPTVQADGTIVLPMDFNVQIVDAPKSSRHVLQLTDTSSPSPLPRRKALLSDFPTDDASTKRRWSRTAGTQTAESPRRSRRSSVAAG